MKVGVINSPTGGWMDTKNFLVCVLQMNTTHGLFIKLIMSYNMHCIASHDTV